MPFFSIVIPTKNRSSIVGFTIQSILRQSFQDFEIIVNDNDDTEATTKVVSDFKDSRLKAFRTNGTLSMIDNWEAAVANATGEYVILLTDRAVLKRFALETIHSAILKYQHDVYVWPHDYVSDNLREIYFGRSGPTEIVSSKDLFELFLTSNYWSYESRLPRGLNSCFAGSFLNEIKRVTGRIFHPVSPDFTLAFLTLGLRSHLVSINRSLFVWGHGSLSNGGGSYSNSDTFVRFMKDAGLGESDLTSHVPLKIKLVHNALCNDLMKLKSKFPRIFEAVELDMVSYFLTCKEEIELQYSNRSEALASWHSTLSQFPETARLINDFKPPKPDLARRVWRRIYNSDAARRLRAKRTSPLPKFDNIIEVVDWIETRAA